MIFFLSIPRNGFNRVTVQVNSCSSFSKKKKRYLSKPEMNINEDIDPTAAELIYVVAQQPARQLALAEPGGSQPQGTSQDYAQRKVGDLNCFTDFKNDGGGDNDDVPLLVPGDDSDAMVLGRGPFWAGRVFGRSRKAWCGLMKGAPGFFWVSVYYVLFFFLCFGFSLIIGFGPDHDWSFGVGCNKQYPANRTVHNHSNHSNTSSAFFHFAVSDFGPLPDGFGTDNDEGFNVDDDDSNGQLRANCHAAEGFGIALIATMPLAFAVLLCATVQGWRKSGPRKGSTVLDLNYHSSAPSYPHTSRNNQGGQRECRECAAYWCCEQLPGLVCDWICTTVCGGGGVLSCLASLCFPGPAAVCDALKEGKCPKEGICVWSSDILSRRPRQECCLDTPFAIGSGHCYLPTGFCPCLHTRRMLWWAASEYSDEEAAQIATQVLAGSSREAVVEYAPAASCTSKCVVGILPLADIFERFDGGGSKSWVDYRSPLTLACELNKPKLANVLLGARATVWNRAGDALPEQKQDSSSSNSPAHVVAATGNLDMFALLNHYANENGDVYACVCVSSDDDAGVPCQKKPKWGTEHELHGTRIKVLAHGTPVEKHAAALPIIAQTTSASDVTTWVMFKNAPGPGWYPFRGEGGGEHFFEKVHWLDAQNSAGQTPIDVARDYGHEQLALWMEHARTGGAADAFVKSASTLLHVHDHHPDAASVGTTASVTSTLARPGKRFPTLDAKLEAFKTHRHDWADDRLLAFAADRALEFISALEPTDALASSATVAAFLRASVAGCLGTPFGKGGHEVTPLSTLLLPIKTFLEEYVQHPLQFGSTTFANLPAAFQAVLVEPAEQIIRESALRMVEQVRQNVDGALLQIADLAAPDSRIYTAQLRKALRGDGQLQFDTMVHKVNARHDLLSNAALAVQPCTSPVELTIRATDAMPGFQAAVDTMVALLKRRGHGSIVAQHRPVSKGTYRIFEKCLLKIAGQDILETPIDASKILDVAGCLIACGTFEDVLAVMEMIYSIGDGGGGAKEVELPVQRPKGKQSKLWRGVSIKTEVVKKVGSGAATGSEDVVVVRGAPLMMRVLSRKGSNTGQHNVRVQASLGTTILEVLKDDDVVEVHERLETVQNRNNVTRVRITCPRTGVTGWMTHRVDFKDGKGWVACLDAVEQSPTPLAPNERYRHTVTSIGAGNNVDKSATSGKGSNNGSPLQLFVGDEIVSINGAPTSAMMPAEVSDLLNDYEEASQPQQLEVHAHGWDVCRMKDSWTGLSKAGWRDYKVNVVFSGIVFEIQVVLESMMTARTKLDGHLAYNEFRFLYECVAYLGDDYKTRLEEASESKMLASERIGRSETAAEQLEDAQLEIEVLQEDVKLRDAEIAALKAEIATLRNEAPA